MLLAYLAPYLHQLRAMRVLLLPHSPNDACTCPPDRTCFTFASSQVVTRFIRYGQFSCLFCSVMKFTCSKCERNANDLRKIKADNAPDASTCAIRQHCINSCTFSIQLHVFMYGLGRCIVMVLLVLYVLQCLDLQYYSCVWITLLQSV